jgi:gliding motility-associated protein GldL
MSNQKQFNYLNFFYGVGAFIILVAAMFKFLGWRYANIIFVIGILVESGVFLISAFDWSSEKGYEWERVFPQLNDEEGEPSYINQSMAEGTQQVQVQKIMETVVTLNSSVTELNNATRKLTKSVEMMEINYETVTSSTEQYQKEIDNLRIKIAAANNQLKDFNQFNINS